MRRRDNDYLVHAVPTLLSLLVTVYTWWLHRVHQYTGSFSVIYNTSAILEQGERNGTVIIIEGYSLIQVYIRQYLPIKATTCTSVVRTYNLMKQL